MLPMQKVDELRRSTFLLTSPSCSPATLFAQSEQSLYNPASPNRMNLSRFKDLWKPEGDGSPSFPMNSAPGVAV
jgi:hypothetical protein